MAENTLPELFDGELVTITDLTLLTKKTKAPTQYTEGTILADMRTAAKFLEDDPELMRVLKGVSGLGTAATRDSVIEGLKSDKYIVEEGSYLVPTPKGIALIEWLEKVFPDLTDVAVTARWEAELAIVAKKGGGAAFEIRVAEIVKNLVATLKTAPPLGGISSSTSKEPPKMADNETRTNKPTDKMLEFAKNIAVKLGKQISDEVMTSFDACKAYLDENKDTAMRPSDKQLSFATSIAERKSLTVPPETLKNGRELSKWIDENK